ncbi:MAG: RrF2 family transcriptional regulator [Bacillota bacterium]
MKISTKGRYGLRAILDLAIYSRGEHMPLKNIAERQSISESYLEQVFAMLKKAGLVSSIKGSQGGYVLAKEAVEITVGDILRAMEGELTVTDKKHEADSCKNRLEVCITNEVWNKMDLAVNSLIDKITLEDLLEEYSNLSSEDAYMFFI